MRCFPSWRVTRRPASGRRSTGRLAARRRCRRAGRLDDAALDELTEFEDEISRPNRYAVQPCGFWQAADQVSVLHRLTGRSLAEVVDHAHRDHQVALWIGRITDEREVRAGSPFGLRRLVGHADERPPGVEAL